MINSKNIMFFGKFHTAFQTAGQYLIVVNPPQKNGNTLEVRNEDTKHECIGVGGKCVRENILHLFKCTREPKIDRENIIFYATVIRIESTEA